MSWLVHECRLAFVALQFLTRVPVPSWVGFEPAWLQHCTRHFPLVGALVGLFCAAVLGLAAQLWPPAVAVGLAMAAGVWLTGGFHEDGWADTCDGLGGAVSRARAIEIMKDSRIGSYGALGLILMLGLKAAALHTAVTQDLGLGLIALVLAQAGSRVAPIWLLRRLPYAGDAEHAKAKPLATQAGSAIWLVALVWLLLPVGILLALRPELTARLALALAVAALLTLWMQAWLRRRLGGFTGDNLGATQQLVELGMLLAWTAHG